MNDASSKPDPTAPERPTRKRMEVVDPHVTRGLSRRLRRTKLFGRLPDRVVWAVFVFVNGFISIAILSALAMATDAPLVFPSLGPTAFLLFFVPGSPTATPRHALLGHGIGILCGYGALWLTGLVHAPPALATGVDGARVLAAALSLASTGALMILCRAAHPPAGATTLIISLGIITTPKHLVLIEVAVALMVAQGFVVNRLAGVDYPMWTRHRGE